MSTRSSVQIHLFTNGDIILDELVNTVDNPKSPAIVYVQSIPPNVSTEIYNPFIQFNDPSKFQLQNVLITPEASNTQPWIFSTSIVPPSFTLHPTNPMLLSLISLGVPMYIYHTAAAPVVFQFIWI